MLNSVECPDCGQRIVNAAPSVENKVLCTACGKKFSLSPIVSPSNIPATTQPLALDPTERSDEPIPLGKEPAQASYGMLSALGWAALLSSAYFGSMGLNRIFLARVPGRVSNFGITSFLGIGRFPGVNWWVAIEFVIASVENILLSVLLIVLARTLTRFDRRASRIAWRSGALRDPAGEPQGSALPYLLPFTACGGVLLLFGLMMQSGDADQVLLMTVYRLIPASAALTLISYGVLLFVGGLACAELRRFFWRMAKTANLLPMRRRGGETSLGEPSERIHRIEMNPCTRYMVATVIFATTAFLTLVGTYFPPINSRTFSRTDFAIIATAFIGVVGGGITLCLLSDLWAEMRNGWMRAAHSVDRLPIRETETPTRRFVSYIRVVRLALLAGSLIFGLIANRGIVPREAFRYFCAAILVFGVIFFLMTWIAAIKRDSFLLTMATSVIPPADTRPALTNKNSPLVRLAVWAALIRGIHAAAPLVITIISELPFLGQADITGLVLGIFYFITMIILIASYTMIPGLWFALVVGDMERAASNLDACSEEPV